VRATRFLGRIRLTWRNLADEQEWLDFVPFASAILSRAVSQSEVASADRDQWVALYLADVRQRLKGRLGSIWRDGRCSLFVFRTRAEAELETWTCVRPHAQLEWHWFRRQPRYAILFEMLHSYQEYVVGIQLPGCAVTLTIPSARIRHDRSLGVFYARGVVCAKLWACPYRFRFSRNWKDPESRVRQPSVDLATVLFGRETYHEEFVDQESRLLLVDMGYAVVAQRFLACWSRPRWLVVRQISRVQVVLIGDTPLHCPELPRSSQREDGGLASVCVDAKTIDEALESLQEMIQRYRAH
jgi:hypothetical protein